MILHVIESGGLYGIEHVLLGLLPACRRHGYDVSLLCLGDSVGPNAALGNALLERGVTVAYAGYRDRVSPRGVWTLNRTLTRLGPRLVHVHGYKATILAGALSLLRRIPCVATYHAEARGVVDFPQFGVYGAMETRVLRRLRATVAVSEPIARELRERGVPEPRIWVIPNGVDDRIQSYSEAPSHGDRGPGAQTVLVVGRLIAEKGVDLAIRTLSQLRASIPRVRLLVAGDGPLRASLGQLAMSEGVAEAVEFLGFVKDIRSLMARCDCVLMPSRTEGSPVSLIEAMAEGRAIVASGVGGIPGTIRHGVEGLLVDRDDINGFVAAVRNVLQDDERRHSLGREARRRYLRDSSTDRMTERYLKLYDQLQRRQGPKRPR
jgi:glycosyltransferase involved in cell wall biosynthesis